MSLTWASGRQQAFLWFGAGQHITLVPLRMESPMTTAVLFFFCDGSGHDEEGRLVS